MDGPVIHAHCHLGSKVTPSSIAEFFEPRLLEVDMTVVSLASQVELEGSSCVGSLTNWS